MTWSPAPTVFLNLLILRHDLMLFKICGLKQTNTLFWSSKAPEKDLR